MSRRPCLSLWLVVIGVSVANVPADASPPLGDRPPDKLGNIPTLKAIDKPATIWSFNSPSERKGLSDVAAANGMVFFGDDSGQVFGLTAKHGRKVWNFDSKFRVFHPPTSDGQRVYFTNEAGIFAVESGTGLRVWMRPMQRAARPIVQGDTVFVADGQGQMHALHAADGTIKWSTTFIDDQPDDPPGFDGDQARFNAAAARPTGVSCDGRYVYQSVFDQCRVVSFNCETGERGPNYQTAGWVWADAAIGKDRVFLGSQDDNVHCFDKSSGQPLWKTTTGSRIESCPAVTDERVYVPSCNGRMYCLDKKTGRELWRFEVDAGPTRAIYSAPIVTGDSVYFAAAEGHVYSLATDTGLLRWKHRPSEGSALYTCPATDGARLFIQCRTRQGIGEDAIIAIGAKSQ